jgi:hypothetical protein
VSVRIRVGVLSELPPGRGKVVDLPDRQVTVFNLDGRFYGAATRRHGRASAPAAPAASCPLYGGVFDVFAEDSPAKLRAEERRCEVHLEGEAVWLILDEE